MEISVITVRNIASYLEEWAPARLAESYDNVGLLAGSYGDPVTGVMVNLDMTEEVVDEAIQKGCNMVVAHHPIWFGGKKRLVEEDNYVARTIIKAIRNRVNLYAIHTNLDNVRHGVNMRMAETLGLKGPEILLPKKSDDPSIGSGMIGQLDTPLSADSFLALVSERFRCGGIRFAGPVDQEISTVALCGGAGSFLTQAALDAGADAFVTGDITYHKYFDQEGRMLLLDIGHYESEQFTSQLIRAYLSEKFSTFAVHLSEVYTNPVRYYPDYRSGAQ